MPELPEVETVRRGLEPAMAGATFQSVTLNRPDLRFPFPTQFADRLTGAVVHRLTRRGKYINVNLDTGETLILHLGMSGRFTVLGQGTPGHYAHQVRGEDHVHAVFHLAGPAGLATIHYADPRRFGFMDLVPTPTLEGCRHFARMGPEPLSDEFDAAALAHGLAGRRTPIKTALLDQRVVAGLGNIYVCEALFRARIAPRRLAQNVGAARVAALVPIIKDVLEAAIHSGGSSLRDYAAADGTMGAFQHRFEVYGRQGEGCVTCEQPIRRIVQGGRSTFYCGACQR